MVDAYIFLKKINFPNYKYFEDVNWAYSDFFEKLMTVLPTLHPVRLNKSKGILKTGLMERYLRNLGQGTKSLKCLRKQGFISIKSYIKRLSATQKSSLQLKTKLSLMKNFQKVLANQNNYVIP